MPTAITVAVVLIAYTPAMHGGFIWDDDFHLTRNPCVVGPLGLKEIWTSTRAVYYPLVLTSFWILQKCVGLNPLPYHVLNVLMHGASAVLLWRVLINLKIDGAWMGALLWAVHPVMVQSVAWITELKNTQSCFFFLWSILFFLKADDSPGPMAVASKRTLNFGLSLLFFAMAISSKPSTVMLPLVLALCLWWRRGRLQWRDLAVLAPFFFISVAASGWTIWEQKFHAGAAGVEWSQSWPERLAMAGLDIWFYLGKIVWPYPLIFIYPRWKIDIAQAITYVPILLALCSLSLLWWKRNGPLRPVFFAAAYFTISLFPVLGFFNVYFFRFSFVSDHFQYLASIGPIVLIAATGSRVFTRSPRRAGATVFAIVVLGLMTITWRQESMYKDNQTLWNETIRQNPKAWIAYNNLSEPLLAQGDFIAAARQASAAIGLYPNYAPAHNNFGLALQGLRRDGEAIEEFRRAIELDPNLPQARLNLAEYLMGQNDLDGAEREYVQAIDSAPEFADAHYNYAVLLAMRRRIPEAVRECRAACALDPHDSQCQSLLRRLTESNPGPR